MCPKCVHGDLKMTEFETRFRRFIAGCPDCQVLDNGVSNPPGGIADFQINGDSVVAELKCLEADKLEPLQRLSTELIETRDLSIYGQIPFYQIIENQFLTEQKSHPHGRWSPA